MNLSLLDAFRPKWQNSNPERRLEAVEEMDIQEQSVLERIALSDENSSVRSAAVKKLTLIPSLSAISKKDNEAGIRRLAESRYFEEVTKMLKIFREPANEEVLSFVNELKDTRYAEELARSMPSSELRMELIKNTGKSAFKVYKIDSESSRLSTSPFGDVAPERKGTLKCTLDTSGMPKGECLIVVTLTTNSPLRPIMNLFVTGWIE